MKRFKNILAAVALLMGVATTAGAQTVEDNYPYNFIGLQGGAQATFTNQKFTDLITPQVAISAGRYFNSKVGARAHFQGWQIKSAITDTYKFNAITGDLDLLLNMTNIIDPNRVSDKFDWVLLAGFGVNYGWDFDEFNAQNNALAMNPNPYVCGSKHSTFNSRLGMQFNFNLSDQLALGLEVDGNMKNDEFNLKRNYNPDFQVQALLGLTYKFGQKKSPVVRRPPVAPVVEQKPEPKPEVKPEPKPEPKPVVKPEPKPETAKPAVLPDEPLKETFFYNIRLSDPDPDAVLNKIAQWCKKYPQKKISIRGYADRGTGNPQVNVGYAKARAEKVAKALQDKGVARNRMTVESFGDTVQPFADNDKNRCVIVVGE